MEFLDQAQNRFPVAVKKKCNKLYFSEGLRDVGAHYLLRFGGWIRLMYADVNKFYVSAFDTLGVEVKYEPLGDHANPINISDDENDAPLMNGVGGGRQYYRTFEKELTWLGVNSDMTVCI